MPTPSVARLGHVGLHCQDLEKQKAFYRDIIGLTITDEDGIKATASVELALEPAQQRDKAEATLKEHLAKLGNTMFQAHDVSLNLRDAWFVPASVANALRREAVAKLEAARLAGWQRPQPSAPVEPPVAYPEQSLSYLANVYNHKARAFYEKHGVKLIDAAYEAHEEEGEVSLMITKHCLRFSYNLCPKQAKGVKGVQGQVRAEPMTLINGSEKLTLKFDCKPCEMHVVGRIKKNVLNASHQQAQEAADAGAPIKFYRSRPQPERIALD